MCLRLVAILFVVVPSRQLQLASALTLFLASTSYRARTRGADISLFNLVKASSWAAVHVYEVFELSNSLSGFKMCAMFRENLFILLIIPMNVLSSITEDDDFIPRYYLRIRDHLIHDIQDW